MIVSSKRRERKCVESIVPWTSQPQAAFPRAACLPYEGRKVIKVGRAREVGDGDQREVDGRLFVCQKQP